MDYLILLAIGIVAVVLAVMTRSVVMRWQIEADANLARNAVQPGFEALETRISSLLQTVRIQQHTIQDLEHRVTELEKRLPPASPL